MIKRHSIIKNYSFCQLFTRNILTIKQKGSILKKYLNLIRYRGVEQLAARRAHNPKVVSSSLTPATTNFIRVARD